MHPSSISLSNVSLCVPILGTKNGTCLSDGPALRGFQKRTLTYSFLRGLAAPVIRKVRVLCYEFTGVTLAWEDGQWVETHKIILAGCSPKKHPNPHVWAEWFLFWWPENNNEKGKQVPFFGCLNFVLWTRQLKKGASRGWLCNLAFCQPTARPSPDQWLNSTAICCCIKCCSR